jgi:prevent-host-death family protein
MTKTIAQRELRNDNAQVIDAVAAGEDFVITRNGTPIAELKPVSQARRQFVSRGDVEKLMANGSSIDFAQFRDDADRLIDQDL